MKTNMMAALGVALTLTACNMQKWNETACDGYQLITQKGGATLGYSTKSGIQIIEQDGFAFKDLDRDGVISPYEDWRLPVEQRVEDLAKRLSIEEIAGLMLYSNHQALPATTYDVSTYNGKPCRSTEMTIGNTRSPTLGGNRPSEEVPEGGPPTPRADYHG